MRTVPALPARIGSIEVTEDAVSTATWDWAHRSLPRYLLAHSIRAYCWGATLGAAEGLDYEAPILWSASLMHDVGLTSIPRNSMCFEFQGASTAQRFLERQGMGVEAADRAAKAIELHMAPSVTIADGTESVLLDRATSIDVRGTDYELIGATRAAVMQAFPRGAFDRHFLAAIRQIGRAHV